MKNSDLDHDPEIDLYLFRDQNTHHPDISLDRDHNPKDIFRHHMLLEICRDRDIYLFPAHFDRYQLMADTDHRLL